MKRKKKEAGAYVAGNEMSVNCLTLGRHDSGKIDGCGMMDTQSFIDDGIEIWKILRG